MCCGRSNGTARPVTQTIVFVAINSETGARIGAPFASFHEALIQARNAGPGHSVKTLYDDEAVAALT
ncbi:MAG TPA: hypothetical protein VMX12_02050, partial [Acidimicrobiia bacterium]|nr:hypothetical protein [Acidimicrobiia bacterium]